VVQVGGRPVLPPRVAGMLLVSDVHGGGHGLLLADILLIAVVIMFLKKKKKKD